MPSRAPAALASTSSAGEPAGTSRSSPRSLTRPSSVMRSPKNTVPMKYERGTCREGLGAVAGRAVGCEQQGQRRAVRRHAARQGACWVRLPAPPGALAQRTPPPKQLERSPAPHWQPATRLREVDGGRSCPGLELEGAVDQQVAAKRAAGDGQQQQRLRQGGRHRGLWVAARQRDGGRQEGKACGELRRGVEHVSRGSEAGGRAGRQAGRRPCGRPGGWRRRLRSGSDAARQAASSAHSGSTSPP